MYVIFIHYVTNPTRHHIGVQIRTTDAIHTLAYQVIPTSLNRRTQQIENLPQDYRVSCNDLYVEDILFNSHTPTIGLPNAVENEVRPAPPPYVQRIGAARAHLPRGVELNQPFIYNLQPFGLPTGVQREPENPEGAIQDPLVDSAPLCANQIRIPDTEIHAILSAALCPEIPIGNPSYQRQGGRALGSNQSPPTPPPTRANSSAGIHNGPRIPPQVQRDHLPSRRQLARARPLGQPYPRPPPRAPPRAVVEPLAGREVPHNQRRSHRVACHCARCRPGGPRVATTT